MRKKLYIFKHFAKSKKLFFCQYLSFSVWFPLSLKHWSPLLYTLYFQLFPIQIECNAKWGLLQIPINKILDFASCLNLFHFFFVLTIYLKLHKLKKKCIFTCTQYNSLNIIAFGSCNNCMHCAALLSFKMSFLTTRRLKVSYI